VCWEEGEQRQATQVRHHAAGAAIIIIELKHAQQSSSKYEHPQRLLIWISGHSKAEGDPSKKER